VTRKLTQLHQARRLTPNRKLQELRINAGLSPNDLGARCGVSPNTIRLAERGYTPGPRIQFAIANCLGVLPLDIWPLSTQRVPS
jgi:DNA-binding XRE family transcriptional regulator